MYSGLTVQAAPVIAKTTDPLRNLSSVTKTTKLRKTRETNEREIKESSGCSPFILVRNAFEMVVRLFAHLRVKSKE